jgi:hypothetical protein
VVSSRRTGCCCLVSVADHGWKFGENRRFLGFQRMQSETERRMLWVAILNVKIAKKHRETDQNCSQSHAACFRCVSLCRRVHRPSQRFRFCWSSSLATLSCSCGRSEHPFMPSCVCLWSPFASHLTQTRPLNSPLPTCHRPTQSSNTRSWSPNA